MGVFGPGVALDWLKRIAQCRDVEVWTCVDVIRSIGDQEDEP